MNSGKSTDMCQPYITNIFCLSGTSFFRTKTYYVPSLFHKVIFSFEKYLYDVLKKPVGNLEVCEIRVNTHTHTHTF